MLRRRFLLLCSALISACPGIGTPRSPTQTRGYQPAHIVPAQRFVYGAEVPDGLFRQCSRATVSPVDGHFALTPTDVEAFESRIADYFRSSTTHPPQPLSEYLFAYAGALSGGRRLLYAAAAPRGTHGVDGPEGVGNMLVCDGGPSYWGIAFDLDSQTFLEPHYNGQA